MAGEEAYIVGGSLRDMLIGLPPHDYDVATSALPQTTLSIFSDMRVIETGLKHGTVTVISEGRPIEVTTFRIDGEYADSRHPDSVSFTRRIEEDLSRRDFTVNAMAYNEQRGLVDIFNGKRDIEGKVLRAVGSPEKRFSEDALRIMRAFRFSAQLGFEIDENTLEGAVAMSSGLESIARERIGCEFVKLVTSEYPQRAVKLMSERGIFKYIFNDFMPDVSVLDKIELLPRTDVCRLALLLWGADERTATESLKGLRLSGKQITGTLSALRGAKMRVENEAEARRLIAATGIYASFAASVSEAMGISPRGATAMVERQQNAPSKLSDLKINGKDLSLMGVKGKMIGETLSELLRVVVDEPLLNDRDTLVRLASEMIKEKERNKNGTA
jgi:tRNA nucleotidyltransferase (CCA-adding enzyme)